MIKKNKKTKNKQVELKAESGIYLINKKISINHLIKK